MIRGTGLCRRPFTNMVNVTSASESTAASVLLLDDEVLVRMEIAEYLRKCGYLVIEAASIEEAKAFIHARKAVDIVLVGMHSITDGFDFSSWVRRQEPKLQIMMAGSLPATAQAAAKLCDEGPTLSRPYQPEHVVDRIKQMLASRER